MRRSVPLVLSVKAANWRMTDSGSENADTVFRHQRKRALERDNYTCQACGFRHVKWQEVHHLDDNHANNDHDNLATLCPYCHMVQHFGLAGRNGEAVLVFMPEIAQADLHHLVRSIQFARSWSDGITRGTRGTPNIDSLRTARDISDAAGTLDSELKARTADAERLIGTSDALELANILMSVSLNNPKVYDRRAEWLHGIRLLPLGVRRDGSKDVMTEMVSGWSAPGGPYSGLVPKTWMQLLKSMKSAEKT